MTETKRFASGRMLTPAVAQRSILVMVMTAELVIERRALADFRVHENLPSGAAIITHHQPDPYPISQPQIPGETGQCKMIPARRQHDFVAGRERQAGDRS